MTDEQATGAPKEGEEMTLSVVPAPTRTTLFPEQSIVAMVAPGSVDVILLRRELVVTSQAATVVKASDEALEFRITGSEMQAMLQDIGHIRLPAQLAKDLGVALLRHVIDHHDADADEILGRLQAGGAPTT